ncbi:hypothetical protein U732_1235 [Clostridium argentinense CDC 2741]|uniref:Uncharacterized protein n=1 Tax=Clostridium argentinense CDC 2741 TaxID=1418104 RepID=A0A0C1UIK9_9CLOT|nr:hypothetical protein [Clostridium argentinense]ARC85540.1 hypothetical protein RSJ17_14025 [Clostridium argentinense]KIE47155.1 hypothetical protein U732_1235 [Clostridium argentinense CDC 2741]NFF40054.1 hypothetical protein [Clostridium argentinense]NFP50246.1 hypothetical protein [Clostridium argentinense]NFP71887.1 hypothetical protein [Clostridium argentinense]
MDKKYRKIVCLTIAILILGVLSVNINSSQIVKEKSSFKIYVKDNPPKIVLDLGEKHIVLNTEIFYNFKDGAELIISNTVEKIISLSRS